jgi:hypothetical protein
MTKGIREFVNAKFVALSIARLGGELSNAAFRKSVMDSAVAKFDISVASAATHYNHTFKAVKAAEPPLVEGLGRADDKKGGRKPIHTVDVIKVKTGEVVAVGVSKGAAANLIAAAAVARKAKLAVKFDLSDPVVEAVAA